MTDRFEEFVSIISLLHKNIQRLKQLEMKEFGLKGPHAMSLFYLSQYPDGLTGAQLCGLVGVDKAAVSRVLAQLNGAGLITYPDPPDGKKYRTRAALTPQGVAVSQQIRQIISDIVQQASGEITPDDRACMYRCLHTISDNIQHMLPSAVNPK